MSTREHAADSELVLGKADHGRPVTAEEFAGAIYEEPWRYERVDGRLVVMSPEGYKHVRKSNSWRDRLVLYKYQHPDVVEEVVTNAWLRVDGGTDRIGDLGVYLAADPSGPKLPDRPPDLMIEVVSPGSANRKRDYVTKRAEYEKAGVREYVIVDTRKRLVTVLELGADGYRERTLAESDMYRTPFLPGLEIPLAEVLNG